MGLSVQLQAGVLTKGPYLVDKGLYIGVDAGRIGLQACMLQVTPYLQPTRYHSSATHKRTIAVPSINVSQQCRQYICLV